MHKTLTLAALSLLATTAVAAAQDLGGLTITNTADNANILVLSGDGVSQLAEVLAQYYASQEEPAWEEEVAPEYGWDEQTYGNRCFTRFGWYWLPEYVPVNWSCPLVDRWGNIVDPQGGVVGQ